jgi:hypothetical protein
LCYFSYKDEIEEAVDKNGAGVAASESGNSNVVVAAVANGVAAVAVANIRSAAVASDENSVHSSGSNVTTSTCIPSQPISSQDTNSVPVISSQETNSVPVISTQEINSVPVFPSVANDRAEDAMPGAGSIASPKISGDSNSNLFGVRSSLVAAIRQVFSREASGPRQVETLLHG